MKRIVHLQRITENVTKVGGGKLGGKGINTANADSVIANRLARDGIRVARLPKTVVLTDDIVTDIKHDRRIAEELVAELVKKGLITRRPLSVRSSALAEDIGGQTLPGAFASIHLPFAGTGGDMLHGKDVEQVVRCLISVACSDEGRDARARVERAHGETGMAVMLQQTVGQVIAGRFFGPRIAGIVDTSEINGEGTTTVTVVAGFGDKAARNMYRGSTIIIGQKPGDVEVKSRQEVGELLRVDEYRKNPMTEIDMVKLLRYMGVQGISKFLDTFVKAHLGKLKQLIETIGRKGPVDLEFAFASGESEQEELYFLQERQSNLRRTRNARYPEVPANAHVLINTSSVLGGETVRTKRLAAYCSS